MNINQDVTIANDVSKSGFGRRQVKRPQQNGRPEQQESIDGRNARNIQCRQNDSNNNQCKSVIHVLHYIFGENNHDTYVCKQNRTL